MNHRRPPRTTLRAAVILAVAGSVASACGPASAPRAVEEAVRERPNVLVIVTDDQRADTLGVMERTRAWFADGTRYTNAVVTTPLCCPTRASIFTGRYAHNHGVVANSERSQVTALDQRTTIQAYLDAAGYRTAIAGKYLTSWPLGTHPPHFDRWVTTTYSTAYRDPRMNVNGKVGEVTGYATDIIAMRAVSFLERFERHDDDPWFLYLAPPAPHKPFEAEPAYADADTGAWMGNPAVVETDRSDKPPWVRERSSSLAEGRATRQKQLRTLLSVDDLVHRVLRRMRALGEEDTLVIFTSDNGYTWGEHGLHQQKRLPYLPSVRIPMLVRWPGHVPAGRDRRIVASIDIAPTILEAARVAPDPSLPSIDGISLLGDDVRRRILLEYFRAPEFTEYPSWAATLTGRSSYVEYYADDLETIVFREYYDLVADPWQNENILADGVPGNEPDVEALSRRLGSDRDCVGVECRGTS